MTATVGQVSASGGQYTKWNWFAWCESCGDGVNVKRRAAAELWATEHNERRHPQK